jgi:Icc-related predicted phosphoesterase
LRIHPVSDIHCEFHRDNGESFMVELGNNIRDNEIDMLVVAGDLGDSRTIEKAYAFMCRYVPHTTSILYIPGNHEYYHSNFDIVDGGRLFGNGDGEVRGQSRLKGLDLIWATLWFNNSDYGSNVPYEKSLNDFNLIRGFKDRVYARNTLDCIYLAQNILPHNIVITHHAPSPMSISLEYLTSNFNRFFVCDMTSTIMERKPKLWIHGHMHTRSDYMLGETRVICNPVGYINEPSEYNPNLVIEIE